MSASTQTGGPITVGLVEDHALVRAGLCRILGTCDGIDVVLVATDGQEALDRLEETTVDVVLLDLRLPIIDGLEVLSRLNEREYPGRVVILTGVDEPATMRTALENGACGYLTKDRAEPQTLADAIRSAHNGLTTLDTELAAVAVRSDATRQDLGSLHGVTPREREVWALVARGMTNAEIARDLFISERTVKYHVGNLFSKTAARSRAELTTLAYREHIVQQ